MITRTLYRILWISISVAGSPWSGAAEAISAAPADLAATLEPVREQHDIPGMVGLVLQGERIVARGAAGVRRRGAPGSVTIDDSFHLGSCTKAMTGTLAAILIEEGKLRWDSTLGEIFGASVKDIHPDWRPVTLRQVLAHRAGFPNGNIPAQVLDEATVSAEHSVEKLRQMVVVRELAKKPEIPPGTKWAYSNVDYIIAAAALEKVTGKSLEELMRERLFGPLGITTGGFGPPGTPGKVDAPWGHDRRGNPVDPGAPSADNPAYFGPAASVHMTIEDWAKFIGFRLRGDPANPDRQVALLKAKTFDELDQWTPDDFYNAGMGFGTIDVAQGSRPDDRGVIFGHEGSNGRWFSKVLIAPEIDLAVLVICNQGGNESEKAVAETALALLKKFAPERNESSGGK